MKNNRPIGIFDSGLGGLTVFNQLRKILPQEKFIYFGDTAHLPYGDKSPETIIKYSQTISRFLFNKNIKLLIVGCNTASAVALNAIKNLSNIPVIDVINPCVQTAILETKNKSIGIIGTEATIASQAYQKTILHHDSSIDISVKACPLLVPIIEEGLLNHKATTEIIKLYLSSFKTSNLDTLILGCTHYPIIKTMIKKEIGYNINIIDSSIVTASYASDFLNQNTLIAEDNHIGKNKFYITDEAQKFNKISEIFLGYPLKNIHKIQL